MNRAERISGTFRPIPLIGVGMGPEDDIFAYELSESEWGIIRTLVRERLSWPEMSDALTKKLDPGAYTHFRLSRERLGVVTNDGRWKDIAFALPKLSECCGERIIRPSVRRRWQCYKCGNFIDAP